MPIDYSQARGCFNPEYSKLLLQSFYQREMKYKHSQPKQVLVGSVWYHKVSQIKQKCYLNLVNFLCFSGQK